MPRCPPGDVECYSRRIIEWLNLPDWISDREDAEFLAQEIDMRFDEYIKQAKHHPDAYEAIRMALEEAIRPLFESWGFLDVYEEYLSEWE